MVSRVVKRFLDYLNFCLKLNEIRSSAKFNSVANIRHWITRALLMILSQ